MDQNYVLSVVVVIVIFYYITKYMYDTYCPVSPAYMAAHSQSMTSSPDVTIMWFYRDTCGHCTRMAPAWKEFANQCPSDIVLRKINTEEYPQMAKDYGVDGVPYIVKEYSNKQRVVYQGDRSAKDLYTFATTY